MHGDYCPTKKLDIKDWIREQNLKPGDAAKCPHCQEVVRVPLAANPPPARMDGMPVAAGKPRRIGPDRITG